MCSVLLRTVVAERNEARGDISELLQARQARPAFGDKKTFSNVHVLQARPVRGAARTVTCTAFARVRPEANLGVLCRTTQTMACQPAIRQ
jgi:hypothetical protein